MFFDRWNEASSHWNSFNKAVMVAFRMRVWYVLDTNIFIKGKKLQELCNRLNGELGDIQDWLSCNKLSLNIVKTHYIIFTPRNKIVENIDIKINNTSIERVYTTKFLDVYIVSQLSWKKHIDYTCKKLSKCVAIISKARKKLYKPSPIMLYYSFAYPYFMYCSHVWGNNYPTNLEKTCISSKETCQNNYKFYFSNPQWTTALCK